MSTCFRGYHVHNVLLWKCLGAPPAQAVCPGQPPLPRVVQEDLVHRHHHEQMQQMKAARQQQLVSQWDAQTQLQDLSQVSPLQTKRGTLDYIWSLLILVGLSWAKRDKPYIHHPTLQNHRFGFFGTHLPNVLNSNGFKSGKTKLIQFRLVRQSLHIVPATFGAVAAPPTKQHYIQGCLGEN